MENKEITNTEEDVKLLKHNNHPKASSKQLKQ